MMSNINRRDFLGRIGLTAGGLLILQSGCAVNSPSRPASAPLSSGVTPSQFASPPFDCGPWVYWFWLDVNVTRQGITADLEAMKAVGIAGVLIMDVSTAGVSDLVAWGLNEGTPANFNGAHFGGSKWYELFRFACEEANRLGLQVNMNNAAGWCGSGGPWITPDLSMQVVVWSSTALAGGKTINTPLPQPEAKMDFYRDIAVLAFPTPPANLSGHGYRIPNLPGVTDTNGVANNRRYNQPTRLDWANLPADQVAPKAGIRDLTDKMDAQGVLRCELPEGHWTILRFGHTTTGVYNHPAPVGGFGLESDKLSRKATLFQFENLMGRIVQSIGPLAGQTLVATHIDSWEIGVQNWTPTMLDDFKRMRGYDLQPYLPILTGQIVDSLEISQRFLWDFRKTIGDLLLENYAVAMRETAQKHGLRLSIEAYSGEPANDVRYGGEAIEPMSECWSWGRYGSADSVTEMTSAGHVYGHNIIGQETFTAGAGEKWLGHPAVVKDIGDWTFCEGINRFVFHRYAMQPWTNPHYSPGMSMGPWGLHYERTQTWWTMSKPWHDYVARCCLMLRQGNFVADVCYMQAEGAPCRFSSPDTQPARKSGHPSARPGYNYDGCPAELIQERMEFENGFLTLPGGMKYRILVLPDSPTMTPRLLGKIKKLVEAGALVIGPKPGKSPSLCNYPKCDDEVQQLATQLWDNGKIVAGVTAAETLAARGVKPDFDCDQPMVRWIHRRTDDVDVYFIANGAATKQYPFDGIPFVAHCAFRISGFQPEIWDPESGRISPVVLYDTSDGMTRIPLVLSAKASVFVVFRRGQKVVPARTISSISRNGKALLNGQKEHRTFQDNEMADFSVPGEYPRATAQALEDGTMQLCVTQPGDYSCTLASGKKVTLSIPNIPEPIQIQGPWTVTFPDGWGAPAHIQLETLIPLNRHADPGVKYFSGTAIYQCRFDVPAELLTADHQIELDLGSVAIMANVTLNGRPLGVLWKSPFRLDVTAVLPAGQNTLEIAVANLWVNRLIGDQQLPADAERTPKGALVRWPQWLLDGKSSPTGRFTFTTWELWHKNDPLVDSGLIGPVQLRTTVRKTVQI